MKTTSYLIAKRLLDIFISLSVLVATFPITIPLALALSIVNKGSPFFSQLRPGLNEKLFRLFKFKTMTDERDANGKLLPDADRLTALGKFVRKTSLDELPQMINVLKGDMSLIGPRPLLVEYLPLYNEDQKKRHQVRPGITGWAQINGRNEISWTRKFELDIWYVENFSLATDFKILIATVEKVLFAKNINKEGHATTEWFNGKN